VIEKTTQVFFEENLGSDSRKRREERDEKKE